MFATRVNLNTRQPWPGLDLPVNPNHL